MPSFNEIIVIYNPISTGGSKANAEQFAEQLAKQMPGQKIKVMRSEYGGHAEKIAADYTAKKGTWLIVSSSGDGGYNEVINGILNGQTNGAVVASVLPSGNANDHHTAMGSGNLFGNIEKVKIQRIDIIKAESTVGGKPWTRYAHSYGGFGITPDTVRELNTKELNQFNEKWYVLTHLLKFKYVQLKTGENIYRYTSIVFATIGQMSKVINLADDASPTDGKMEVYETKYQSPWQLLRLLFKASFIGMTESKRVTTYKLRTVAPTLIQLDGEVERLDSEADITIRCIKRGLRTIL